VHIPLLAPEGREALGDLITQYMKAAVVLSFATAGGLYQTDLVHLALTLPDNLLQYW
jgi:type IV secretion system protein VirB6